MKVITIGTSPNLITAKGKINAWILQYLYLKGYSVSSIVWDHSNIYYPPENDNKHYYKFENAKNNIKIPITPILRDNNESIVCYELLNNLQPDVVITVGDITDFLFMKAVKIFQQNKFKWIFVSMNYSNPTSKNNLEILNDIDKIICCNKTGYNEFKEYNNNIECQYVGCNKNVYNYSEQERSNEVNIMNISKNNQSDNFVPVIQSVGDLSENSTIDYNLYLHTNTHDDGDYIIDDILEKYNCKFIEFPEKYASDYKDINDISDFDMAKKMQSSDVIVSTQIAAGTAMSIFQAISCGCFPIMPDYGIYREIADEISKNSDQKIKKEDMLIKVVEFTSKNNSILNICDKNDLKFKILNYVQKYKKNKGLPSLISKLMNNSNIDFLEKIRLNVESVFKEKDNIVLETV